MSAVRCRFYAFETWRRTRDFHSPGTPFGDRGESCERVGDKPAGNTELFARRAVSHVPSQTRARELWSSDIILKIMLWNDLRYALRLMWRNPGFTVVAVLSLALGIGANTAIFSLFYTVVLRQLPVAHPEQLVEFLTKGPGQPRDDGVRRWD